VKFCNHQFAFFPVAIESQLENIKKIMVNFSPLYLTVYAGFFSKRTSRYGIVRVGVKENTWTKVGFQGDGYISRFLKCKNINNPTTMHC
jgi:hypothetical protein